MKCKELWLYGNDMGNEGAKDIAKALEMNTTMTWLNLWKNNIGDVGAIEIANTLLRSNATLETLWIYNNNLGEATMTQIETLLLYPRIERNAEKILHNVGRTAPSTRS